jgi:hypothetical protein
MLSSFDLMVSNIAKGITRTSEITAKAIKIDSHNPILIYNSVFIIKLNLIINLHLN